MPFDGSGNFNRVMDWTNDAAANIKIRADRHDQNDDDIASGLSNTITKDGQSQPTADIPMNGKKLINLGAPVNPTDAATKGYADTADALKANIASPTFTGKVTLPTGAAGLAPANLPVPAANPTTPATGDFWPDVATGKWKYRLVSTTLTFAAIELANTWTLGQTFNALLTLSLSTIGAIGQSGTNTGTGMAVTAPNNAGAAAFISFNRLSTFAVNFGLDTDNVLKVGGWSMGANAYRILHEGLASGSFSGAYSWTGAQSYSGADLTLTNSGAFQSVFVNDGTKSGGVTYTPTAAGGNMRMVTNGGAFTLAADGNSSTAYTLVVYIANNATAGAITLSGWTAITGDSFGTVNGASYICSIVHFGGVRTINIQAL